MPGEPDLIDLLAKHELALGRLYETFAAVFPRHATFWRTLAQEEQNHADQVEELRRDGAVNRWLMHGTNVKPGGVSASIGYIESTITRGRAGAMGLIQALVIARDLETSLIEGQFSKMTPSPSPAVGAVIAELAAGTERHRAMVIELLETEKRGGI